MPIGQMATACMRQCLRSACQLNHVLPGIVLPFLLHAGLHLLFVGTQLTAAAYLLQCLAYACQIEPAVSEQEALQLVKLLFTTANALQGTLATGSISFQLAANASANWLLHDVTGWQLIGCDAAQSCMRMLSCQALKVMLLSTVRPILCCKLCLLLTKQAT